LFRRGRALAGGAGVPGRGRGKAAVIGILGLAAVIVLTGGIVMVLRAHHSQQAASSVGAGTSRAAAGHRDARTATMLQALRVVSAAPAPGARRVNGSQPIRLSLSGVPAPGSPMPRISPPVPGTWSREGAGLTFTPSAGFPEDTKITITVPGQGGTGSAGWTASFSTGSYSTLRLQQLLAQLGYLPLSWSANLGGAVMPGNALAQLEAAYQPPAGRFTWISGYPSELASFWQPGETNLIGTGAIMAFESDHGLPLDGLASPALWTDLLRAAEAQQDNPNGYTYAIASKVLPETLTIWHDGREVFSSPANTGIPIDPTADGTFPVYLRYRFQVMQGTNPDGSHYADPVQFVSYFHVGEAVHYFPRYSYGWPQSLGCVELPLDAAAQAWPYLTYGSLVTVQP
jgi:peptidoglycan hydrolase-like protein with peptidoglycan-binding domain